MLARALEEALAWALLFLVVAYAVALVAGGAAVDEGVPLVAVGLLLCGELAAWSLEERHGIAVDRAVLAARALAVGLLAAAGLAAAAIVVALAAVPAGGGLGWTAAGALAAVLAIGAAARLVRR